MLGSPSNALVVRSSSSQVVSAQKLEAVREKDFYNLVKVALLAKTKTDSMSDEHVLRLKKILSDIMFPEKPKAQLLVIIEDIAKDEPDQADELFPILQRIIAERIADIIIKAKRAAPAPEKTKGKQKASKTEKPDDADGDDPDKRLEIVSEKSPPQHLANLYMDLGTAEYREALKAEALTRTTETESKILVSLESQVVGFETKAQNAQKSAELARRKGEAQESIKGIVNMMARNGVGGRVSTLSIAAAPEPAAAAQTPEYEVPTPSETSSSTSSRSSSSNSLPAQTGGIFGKFVRSDKGAPPPAQNAKTPQ